MTCERGFTCKRSCVFFVRTRTLTLTFPLTGTWVTFGGQISDEVRHYVKSII